MKHPSQRGGGPFDHRPRPDPDLDRLERLLAEHRRMQRLNNLVFVACSAMMLAASVILAAAIVLDALVLRPAGG